MRVYIWKNITRICAKIIQGYTHFGGKHKFSHVKSNTVIFKPMVSNYTREIRSKVMKEKTIQIIVNEKGAKSSPV